jgi:hypothetical protein
VVCYGTFHLIVSSAILPATDRVIRGPDGTALTIAPDGAITVRQGRGTSDQSQRWPVFLSDGTNERGTVSNPLRVDPLGTGKTLRRAVASLSATGDVVAAVAGKRIKVYQYALQSQTDGMTVQLRSGTAGPLLTLPWTLNAREGAVGGAVSPPAFLFGTSAGQSLRAIVTGTGTVTVEVSYWDDDAS